MAKKSKPKKCVHNHSSYCKHCSKVKCWIGRKDGHENGYLYSFLKENNYPVNKIIETLTKRVKDVSITMLLTAIYSYMLVLDSDTNPYNCALKTSIARDIYEQIIKKQQKLPTANNKQKLKFKVHEAILLLEIIQENQNDPEIALESIKQSIDQQLELYQYPTNN